MLEVSNLRKTYFPKKGVPVLALKGVSMKFADKGLVFILGKSGSGKSTLLNLLGGLDKYDEGDIAVRGKSTKDFSQADFDSYRNTYVGFVFQEYNILDDFSVGANIALAIELQGRKASNEDVNQILDTLDLNGYGSRRTNELSGGQKQRIAIARALVKNPDIILADEPTGALDSKTGMQIFEILKKLSKDKLVIVVSHDRDFAETFGDRVIELADGKIISDITKTTIVNDHAEENLQYVEREGIVIKEGYKLTAKDLKMINLYLEKEKNLNIVSKTNEKFKTQEVFVETKEDLAIKTYENEFKMIKSRLPFKMALKMGVSGLNHKKFRLFMTILLSLVAFTLFGVTDALAAYNKIDATVNSIIDGDIEAIAFAKTKTVDMGDYLNTFDLSISQEDIDELNQNIGQETGVDFKPVYTAGASDYQSAFSIVNGFSSFADRNYNSYYLDSISGFVEFTKNELLDLGFTVQGEMPTKDDEIAITSYIFDHFNEKGYGFVEGENTIDIKPENISQPADLIGRYIYLSNYNIDDLFKLKITAIVDTKLQSERYEALKNPTNDISEYLLSEEFRTVVQYGYHGLGFVNQGYINKLIENESNKGLIIGDTINLAYVSTNEGAYLYANSVSLFADFDKEIIFFDAEKTALEEDEIIVDWLQLIEGFYSQIVVDGSFNGTLFDYVSSTYENLLEQYAEDNYLVAESNGLFLEELGTNDIPVQDKIDFYKEYLANGGYSVNEYGDKTGSEIVNEIPSTCRLILKQLENVTLERILNNNYTFQNEIGVAKVVGVYLTPSGENSRPIIVDDDLYAEIELYANQDPYKFALAKMPGDRWIIREIVEFSYKIENGVAYPLRNSATPMLQMANDLVENVARVFLYIGIAFAVFSALMLSNFIATSVSYKKREIGILRALGARSSDVFRIFFNESAIIALFNCLLASIATFISVIIINNSLRTGAGLTITIFTFSIRQVALLFLISLFVAFIASFLPVFRIARKKPVDAISNK